MPPRKLKYAITKKCTTRSHKPTVVYESLNATVESALVSETDSEPAIIIQSDYCAENFNIFTMAEERTITPLSFNGAATEDGAAWSRQFRLYVAYRDLKDDKPLQLFKVLMKGAAGEWLDSLADDKKDSLVHLEAAFMTRYQTPEIIKYKSARDIFSRRQRDNETVDDFVCSMLKLANIIDLDERAQRYAILNGLKANIAAYVTQQRPETLEQLTEHARVAELTCPPIPEAGTTIIQDQLGELQLELKRLSSKLDASSCSPMTTPHRSTIPEGRRVSFDTARRDPSPARGYRPANERRDAIPSRMASNVKQTANQRYDARGAANYQQTALSPASSCQRCGSRYCTNPLYCRFIHLTCHYCQKVGHAQRVCRQRMQDQNRQY